MEQKPDLILGEPLKKTPRSLSGEDKVILNRILEDSNHRIWDGAVRSILSSDPESKSKLLEKAFDGDTKNVFTAVSILTNDFSTFDISYPIELNDERFEGEEKASVENLARFEIALLHRNLEGLEKLLSKLGESGDKSQLALWEHTLRVVSYMAFSAKLLKEEAKTQDAVEFLLNHCDMARGGYIVDFPLFNSILVCGNGSQVAKGKRILANALLNNDYLGKFAEKEIVLQGYAHPGSNYLGEQKKFLADVIDAFGLKGEDSIKAWGQTFARDEQNYSAEFTANFHSLLDIERKRPGIGAFLQLEFGINDFARYPEELLIDQYDSKDRRDSMPCGVIINPRSDRNGAFYQYKELYGKLLNQAKGKYRILAWEVGDVRGLINALNKTRRNQCPISFAIIGGHGTAESIEFTAGENQTKGKLNRKDLGRKGVSSVELAFTNNPTIILNSCGTGEVGGIGQGISEIGEDNSRIKKWINNVILKLNLISNSPRFKPTVIAPPEPTSIKYINARINSEGVTFDVMYQKEKDGKMQDVLPQIYRG